MDNKDTIRNPTISDITDKTGLSRAAFAREYHIPVRTLENWASGSRACPEYVLSLLERCVTQNPAPLLNGKPLPLKKLRDKCGISRAVLSREYNIPVQTLKNWESGDHKCPPYVAELLERCVRYDHLPLYFCTFYYVSRDPAKAEGGGWYISRSQVAHYMNEKELTEKNGFYDLKKCKAEKRKAEKKIKELANYEGYKYTCHIMRIEKALDLIHKMK